MACPHRSIAKISDIGIPDAVIVTLCQINNCAAHAYSNYASSRLDYSSMVRLRSIKKMHALGATSTGRPNKDTGNIQAKVNATQTTCDVQVLNGAHFLLGLPEAWVAAQLAQGTAPGSQALPRTCDPPCLRHQPPHMLRYKFLTPFVYKL